MLHGNTLKLEWDNKNESIKYAIWNPINIYHDLKWDPKRETIEDARWRIRILPKHLLNLNGTPEKEYI